MNIHNFLSNLYFQVLVKKCYGDKKKRQKRRNWKLKTLNKEVAGTDHDSLDRYYDLQGNCQNFYPVPNSGLD